MTLNVYFVLLSPYSLQSVPLPLTMQVIVPRRGDHVGCRNAGFGAHCGSNPQTPKLHQEHIKMVLQKTNWLRGVVAEGSFCYPKAARMPVLVWDDDLANLASLHTKGCVTETNKCRSTERFRSPGQSSYEISGDTLPSAMDILNFALRDWYLQKDNLTRKDIGSYPAGEDKGLKNMANLISDKVTAIGCGLTHWEEGKLKRALFTCNFSSSNVPGHPIYQRGDNFATKCAKTHPYYKSLCNSDEHIKPNK
uniref:Tabinhibitin 4 n=1 Tax=Tabanus yao TaxID=485572 RepID=INH4_TABYA|nr:RecName: Full=Tabinhibitin 4; Flags: Precursor [Tabanus yao]ACS72294.1 RGD-containing platelet inhibitor 4 [Tabanus yao]